MDRSDIKIIMINGKKVGIHRFELSMMEENPSIMIIAKRRSGKSWVCRDILRHFKKIPCTMVIAPSEEKGDNPFYSEFIPDSFIYYSYESETLQKLFDRQDKIIKKSKEKMKQGILIDPRIIFLMDDCLAEKGKWAKDPLIYQLMFNGRHSKILYILTMQEPIGIRPDLRSNFDYIFLLASDNYGHIKKIYENYANFFNKISIFQGVFKQLTADYHSMVVANVGANYELSKKIYWYKATNISIGYIGANQFKKIHDANYIMKQED